MFLGREHDGQLRELFTSYGRKDIYEFQYAWGYPIRDVRNGLGVERLHETARNDAQRPSPRVAALQQKPDQFLDKQWHAAGALSYTFDYFLCEGMSGGKLLDHVSNLITVERHQRNRAVV